MDINLSLLSGEIIILLTALALLMVTVFRKVSSDTFASFSIVVLVFTAFIFYHGATGTTFNGSFIQDTFAVYFKIIFCLSAIMAIMLSVDYLHKLPGNRNEFLILILFATLGMMFMASSGDFISLYISLELASISLYILAAYMRENVESIEAGMKYFLLSFVAATVLLYGISLVYGATGSTNFIEIASTISGGGANQPLLLIGMLLVICGFCFKIASFPFHIWVPDVYQGSPTPVTAFLAVGSKAAGFAIITRVLLTVFIGMELEWTFLIAVLSAITMTIGNVIAIKQTNIKRLLGYSSIAHAGYLMMGLTGASIFGGGSTLFYLLAYLFSNMAAFVSIIIFSSKTNSYEISDYAGLSRRSPLLAVTILLAFLSLAGVPPLAGFIGKFYLLATAVEKGYAWLAYIGGINVVISLYYYLSIIKKVYIEDVKDETPIEITPYLKIALVISLIGIIVIGVYPAPFSEFAMVASKSLF